mgnify:CR=1 FL=1
MSTRRCGTAAESSPGTDAWTGERVPRDGHLARSWRSSPWFQQLPGSLLHGPAASVCSAERRRPSAARRSRTVDIVHFFLHRIDGNRSGWKEASCSAQASSGCNRRPHGTSGDPGGPRGATSVVRGTMCVRVPCVLFSLYRRVWIRFTGRTPRRNACENATSALIYHPCRCLDAPRDAARRREAPRGAARRRHAPRGAATRRDVP